jgi:hypothetical protein
MGGRQILHNVCLSGSHKYCKQKKREAFQQHNTNSPEELVSEKKLSGL